MENKLTQSAQLQQKQLLSQKQQQSLELLHLPQIELDMRINNELAANPLLEEKELLPQMGSAEETQEINGETPSDPEQDAARLLWGDDLPTGSRYADGAQDDDRDPDGNFIAPQRSMEEQLKSEIATSDLHERQKELAGIIIENLDERGYLISHLADLAMLCDADLDEMNNALKLVQSLDPAGIAARDLGECLRLQLERKNQLTPLLEKLTQPEMLNEIEANHIPRLAARLAVTIEQLKQALQQLKKLVPSPGGILTGQMPKCSLPELEIQWNGREYTVNTPFAREKNLFISASYNQLLQDPDTSAEDKNYIREKLRSAEELLQSLRMRGETLDGIGRVLIRTQSAFLDEGASALKPLTMKQAGEMLGLHETTISRAVADKFVKTPQGTFPLRYFFSGGYKNDDGEDVAARAVQEKIREIVDSEDPHNPISDDKIAQLLADQGLNVARRTVAKYRDILKIPSTRLRKKY